MQIKLTFFVSLHHFCIFAVRLSHMHRVFYAKIYNLHCARKLYVGHVRQT